MLAIAVLPTYATLGVAAPILLLLVRLVQGLSVGGEYGTSATYMSEVASKGNRGFYSSFQYVTLIGGQLCAILVLLLLEQVFLTGEQLRAWGWRIPFIIGALLALTLVFGRVFCGWICPFGTLHHFFGWILPSKKGRGASRVEANVGGGIGQESVEVFILNQGVRE